MLEKKRKGKKKQEKATPVGDHNGSLCMETVAARDSQSCYPINVHVFSVNDKCAFMKI